MMNKSKAQQRLAQLQQLRYRENMHCKQGSSFNDYCCAAAAAAAGGHHHGECTNHHKLQIRRTQINHCQKCNTFFGHHLYSSQMLKQTL